VIQIESKHAERLDEPLHVGLVAELLAHPHELAAGDARPEAKRPQANRRIHPGEHRAVDRLEFVRHAQVKPLRDRGLRALGLEVLERGDTETPIQVRPGHVGEPLQPVVVR